MSTFSYRDYRIRHRYASNDMLFVYTLLEDKIMARIDIRSYDLPTQAIFIYSASSPSPGGGFLPSSKFFTLRKAVDHAIEFYESELLDCVVL